MGVKIYAALIDITLIVLQAVRMGPSMRIPLYNAWVVLMYILMFYFHRDVRLVQMLVPVHHVKQDFICFTVFVKEI